MALKMSQSLKQTQSLMMTPQLQQAIKMLTLNHLEMTDMIAQEMVENPMLEEVGGDSTNDEGDNFQADSIEMQNKESSEPENIGNDSVIDKDDFDWNSYIEHNSSHSTPSNMAKGDSEDTPNYENMVSSGHSLAEHLEWQLRMEEMSVADWKIAEHIIHNIDNTGYLVCTLEEIIAETKAEMKDVDFVLKRIQKLDPLGCGARDLKECLTIQAEALIPRFPLIELIVKDHLELLKKKDYASIAKLTGVSSATIKEAELIIQTFNPRPGRLVSSDDTHYIVPDIYVQQVGGEFVVLVNDDGVPRLRISNLYKEILKKSGSNVEAREFVEDKLRAAKWLIKSIQNRQKTITRVAKAIVRQQQDFFKRGPEYLRPMILKDVADEIGMHESTVSRVTSNKYMHTPIGIFELKYFFNAGIGGKSGGLDVSNEALKVKLKRLIEAESPKRPLSDQKLAELLSQEDVKVARRTVAKYREMMGIDSSAMRKKK
jgi:RNA polymerase sigma-54 factor